MDYEYDYSQNNGLRLGYDYIILKMLGYDYSWITVRLQLDYNWITVGLQLDYSQITTKSLVPELQRSQQQDTTVASNTPKQQIASPH